MQTQHEDFISMPGLRERGWTDALIRDHLGEPDKRKINPHYKCAAPMRLYRAARVEAVEASEEWADILKRSEKRRASARRAVETKTEALRDEITDVEIVVPVLDAEVLLQQAIVHYNDFQGPRAIRRGNYYWSPATQTSDPDFLARIIVNYIRHELTCYEYQLETTHGRVGRRDVTGTISSRIYEAIAAAYPDLADECYRQRMAKFDAASWCI